MTLQTIKEALGDEPFYFLQKLTFVAPLAACMFYDQPLAGVALGTSVVTISFLAKAFFNSILPTYLFEEEGVYESLAVLNNSIGVALSAYLFCRAGYLL